MHDLTFANEIISALKEKTKTLGKDQKIILVEAALSPLSHVKPKALEETIRTLVKGTPFEKIPVRIKILQLGMRCNSCKNKFMIDKPSIKCPSCLSHDIEIVYSKEFMIECIEVQ
jgi:Zn finger protein HypA/HybF involved in hydrogenase expression